MAGRLTGAEFQDFDGAFLNAGLARKKPSFYFGIPGFIGPPTAVEAQIYWHNARALAERVARSNRKIMGRRK